MSKSPTSRTRRLLATAAAAATVALPLTAVTTLPAEAATPRNGVCETGEVCFYYNSNYAGSVSDFTASVANYGTDPSTCYTFRGAGSGQGQCIKNNVASVRNLSGKAVRVHYNSNYGGTSQTINANSAANLNATMKNNNASHVFVDAPTPGASFASPAPSWAPISAGWYYPSGGFHGAVDFAYRGDVYSACKGTVDAVNINWTYANRNAYRVSGSTNYVWVNCGNGIRMGYAHFFQNQLPSHIKVGYAVKAGERLFPVGNQGNSSGYHLHFEVRQNGTKIRPLDFLRSKGVQGLPS